MSDRLNFLVYLNAYADRNPSNNPSRSAFKWTREVNSLAVSNPSSMQFSLAPGETRSLISGMRTLTQDSTTEYSIALVPGQTTIYQLTWVGGTDPGFRPSRTSGADASTQVTTSLNGTVLTFTANGTYASFTGEVAGMSTPVTITANNLGVGGNSVVLSGDGSSSINLLISNWNTAHPSNEITLTSGDGTQVPSSTAFASFTGMVAGMSSNVTITANDPGSIGNSVSLEFNGIISINGEIAAWNTANPSNQVTLTSGSGTQIPDNGTYIDLTGGNGVIDLSGGSTPFNLISGGVVVGDFVQVGNLFNIANQGQWQIIAVTATSFSVVNAEGVAQGPVTLGSGFASQIDIFGALGVQAGDTLLITGGFSPVTWGSYIVTEVTDMWVQFSSLGVLPAQGPIMTEDITFYFDAQRLVYLESDQNVTMVINGESGNEISPIANCLCQIQPGVFLRTSTIYSLTVTNISASTANLYLAAVE